MRPLLFRMLVFALHGVAMVLLTMFQCLIYEVSNRITGKNDTCTYVALMLTQRGNQRVSWVCIAVSSFIVLGVAILGFLVFSPWVKSTFTLSRMLRCRANDGIFSPMVDTRPRLRESCHHRHQVFTTGLHQFQTQVYWYRAFFFLGLNLHTYAWICFSEGWSIWQVLLDVVGGLLSFLQNGLIAIDKGSFYRPPIVCTC